MAGKKKAGLRCPICKEEFKYVANLVGHLLSAHKDYDEQVEEPEPEPEEEKEVYECEFCGAQFETEAEAQQHVYEEHKEELAKRVEELMQDEEFMGELKEKAQEVLKNGGGENGGKDKEADK